jgi:hypothetical protein
MGLRRINPTPARTGIGDRSNLTSLFQTAMSHETGTGQNGLQSLRKQSNSLSAKHGENEQIWGNSRPKAGSGRSSSGVSVFVFMTFLSSLVF